MTAGNDERRPVGGGAHVEITTNTTCPTLQPDPTEGTSDAPDSKAEPSSSKAEGLETARALARAGVPIFLAAPDGQGGFHHPRRWELTQPDPAALDGWRPGMAVCALMGVACDGVDVDPRHDGEASASALRAAGAYPRTFGRALTPSGGWHDLVPRLRTGSRDNTLPGLDLKGGRTGRVGTAGRGFLYIAPTERASKVTGEVMPYVWQTAPDLDGIAEEEAAEEVQALAGIVRQALASKDKPPKASGRPPNLTEPQRTAAGRYVTAAVEAIVAELTAMTEWPEGYRDGRGRGWEKASADAAYRLGALTRAAWNDLSPDQARKAYLTACPLPAAALKWQQQCGRAEPAPWPVVLDLPADMFPTDPDGATDDMPEPDAEQVETPSKAAVQPEGPAHRHVRLRPASSFSPRPVFWLWANRMPRGELALLAGREGIGKSTVAYTLAAQITRGTLEGDCHGSPRAVFVAATEDSWEHTIVPRLMAAGADLDRVFCVDVTTSEEVETGLQLPRDLVSLEAAMTEHQAALLLLDPLISRLSSTLDTHKDADVRLGLEPVVRIAQRTGAAVLGIIHVNKSGGADALNTIMGSRAFAAVARAVLFVMLDPDDDAVRLLGTPKSNLGRTDLPTLAFSIDSAKVADTDEGPVWSSRLHWLADRAQSIREVLEASLETSEARSATSEAADWLTDFLASKGGTEESATVKERGRQAGHSLTTLKAAAKRLKVSSKAEGFPRKTWWSLPGTQLDGPSLQLVAPVGPTPGETCPTGLTGPTESVSPVGPVGPVGQAPTRGRPTAHARKTPAAVAPDDDAPPF